MKKRLSNGVLATIIIVVAVLIDQILKFWVKTSFFYGEEVKIAEWFRLVFIENNGMAFGMEFGSKFFLTWFRIIAVALLIWYLVKLRKRTDVPTGYVACIAFITAGALGNVIDCIFYGVVFDAPQAPLVAQFLPAEGGYESLFNGRVVDMFYFPLCEWDWPQWMPWIGGQHFKFFEPIFNFADACLSVSVIVLILFYSRHLLSNEKKENAQDSIATHGDDSTDQNSDEVS
ncbi:MAG: lipoprotein signal peptidase [Muribaculaceae bacterium]|nr:lipoprotein signal peptidase [Muribaculaceae bacterium]